MITLANRILAWSVLLASFKPLLAGLYDDYTLTNADKQRKVFVELWAWGPDDIYGRSWSYQIEFRGVLDPGQKVRHHRFYKDEYFLLGPEDTTIHKNRHNLIRYDICDLPELGGWFRYEGSADYQVGYWNHLGVTAQKRQSKSAPDHAPEDAGEHAAGTWTPWRTPAAGSHGSKPNGPTCLGEAMRSTSHSSGTPWMALAGCGAPWFPAPGNPSP
jgi:hypothetical protein